MSSEDDNQSLVKVAEEILSIQGVAEQATNIGEIAKSLAEEDYEEFPDIEKEIKDSADEVIKGSNDLTAAARNLKNSNLKEGYQQLVDGCRLCGTNCIKVLQIVYGASFKKLEAEQEQAYDLSKQMDDAIDKEDLEALSNIAGELCSAANQISTDMLEQADNETIPSDKAEMQEIANRLQELSDNLLDAVNAYLEDPDNEELKQKMKNAKDDLMKEMDRAKERVGKSHNAAMDQQADYDQRAAEQAMIIDDKIKNSKPIIPKEEQIQRGMAVLENLDKMGDAVFWNNPKDFVAATNENMQDVPKFVDGRIADARSENNPTKEENAKEIKDEFQNFVDSSKIAFASPNDETKKDDAIEKYKKDRELIVSALKDLGVPDYNIPPIPEIEETIIDFGNEESAVLDEAAKKKLPKKKLDELKKEYDALQAMEYAVDEGDNNNFVKNAKGVIADVPSLAKEVLDDATKTKDDDIIDALAAEGINKKQAQSILEENDRHNDLIPEIVKMKQDIVELEDAVDNHSSPAFKLFPKIREKADKTHNPMLAAYADAMERKFADAINNSKASIQDPNNDAKQQQAQKSIKDMKDTIDDALRECSARPDEMHVEVKEKPDNDIVKAAKKAKDNIAKTKEALIDGDMEELADAVMDLDTTEGELLKLMAEDAKKSGSKQKVDLVKKVNADYEDAFDAIKKSKKNPDDNEARKNAEDKLDKYRETLDNVLENQGKPPKSTEKLSNRVNDDLQKMHVGLENGDVEMVKEGNKDVAKDMDNLIQAKKKDGESVDDIIIPVKEAQASAIASARDPKNSMKKQKALRDIKNAKNALSGDAKKEDDTNNDVANKANKTKGECSKVKMAMYDDDPIELADAMIDLETAEKELVHALQEDAKKSGKNHNDIIKRADVGLVEALDAVRKAKKSGNSDDLLKAENKLDDLSSLCETVSSKCGKPSKASGKGARKLKETAKKAEYAYNKRDPEMYNQTNKELVKNANDLCKQLESDGQQKKAKEINDAVVGAIKAMNDGYNDKTGKKDKVTKEKFDKLRDVLDDVLLKNGEPIPDVTKDDSDAMQKRAMLQEDALIIGEALQALANDNKQMIDKLKDSDLTKDNVKLQDLLKKAEDISNEAENAIKKAMEEPEEKKKTTCCNEILKEEGHPIKESAKHAKKLKEQLSKMNASMLNKEPDTAMLAKMGALEEVKLLKAHMDKEKSNEFDNLSKKTEQAVKAAIEQCDGFMRDPNNKMKKQKAGDSLENAVDIVDEVIVACGEQVSTSPKDRRNEKALNHCRKLKNDTTKTKEGLFDTNDKIINDSLASLNDDCDDLISDLNEMATKDGNTRAKKIADQLAKSKATAEQQVKNAQKSKDPKSIDEAEKALDVVNGICDIVRSECGRPTKDGAKAGQKAKEKVSKVTSAVGKGNKPQIDAAINELKNAEKDLIDALVNEAKKENDNDKLKMAKDCKDDIDKVINDANEAKSGDVGKKDKCRERADRAKKTIDEVMKKEGEPSYGVKDLETQQAIKEMTEFADAIILNENEEAHVMLQGMMKAGAKIADAMRTGDEAQLKNALDEFEKNKKEKDEILEKAIEKSRPQDREMLRAANEKLDDLANDQIALAKSALKDGELKSKAPKAQKNSGETSKIAQAMEELFANPPAIIADDQAEAIKNDCKIAEALSKNPNDKKAKELKKRLKKDTDAYQNAIERMLNNSDLSPADKAALEKKLKEVKDKSDAVDKALGDLSKNKNDKQAQAALSKNAQDLAKAVDSLNDMYDVPAKAQCKKTQKALEKRKSSRTLDDDIKDCVIATSAAKSDVEKLHEQLKGGKGKGCKLISIADAMSQLADARESLRNGDKEKARKQLESLKNMLNEALKDPNLDEETRRSIKDILDKIDLALSDLDKAETSGLLDEIEGMLNNLNDVLGDDLTEQAKAKAKARGLAARARSGKKGDISSLINGFKNLAGNMKGLKSDVRDEAHQGMEGLSESARSALALDDMLEDMSNGVDLDLMLGDMEEEEETFDAPKNSLQSELNSVADLIKTTATEESKPKATGRDKKMVQYQAPSVIGDIANHFKELARHAAEANKEGIIVEGRTIAAAIAQFCKELQKAQPICKDRRTADEIARALQTLKNLSTQLKILCSVKAATVGQGDTEGDNQLIAICKTIGNSMKDGIESLAVANRTKSLEN
ncbi:Axoneme-associated protein mst101 [Entamoeba marina]